MIATAAVIAATSSSHAHSCGTLVEIPLISLKLLFLAMLVGIAGGAWYGWLEAGSIEHTPQ